MTFEFVDIVIVDILPHVRTCDNGTFYIVHSHSAIVIYVFLAFLVLCVCVVVT